MANRNINKPSPNKNISKFSSDKNQASALCEGTLELDACYFFESLDSIVRYEYQPDSYQYVLNGRTINFYPDFKLYFDTGEVILVEIKPFRKACKNTFKDKFKARREAIRKNGNDFILLTEKQIRKEPLLDNLKYLYRQKDLNITLSDTDINIIQFLSKNNQCNLSDISLGLNLESGIIKNSLAHLYNLKKIDINIDTDNITKNPNIYFGDTIKKFTLEIKDEFDDLLEEFTEENRFTKLKDSETIQRDLDSFGDDIKSEAIKRYKLFSLIDRNLKSGWTQKNLEPLIDKYISYVDIPKPSWRTIINWKNKLIKYNGELIAFVKEHHLKGNRVKRITGDEDEFDAALERFLDAKRPSVFNTYKFYRDQIIIKNDRDNTNIPIITYKSFNLRIKKLPPYPIALARHGKALADRWFNYCGKHKPPSRILERVEIDHTPLDIILLDDELSIPIGRPYLTLLIDVYSGCIHGFHLGFKAPSYYSVSKAILHSIKPKEYIHDVYPSIVNDWPCKGKIENLIVDNGAEFWSKNLEHACLEARINIQFNQVRKPWLKPFVERYFKVINECFLNWIPGKTFSNIMEKEDYNPQKDAVMHLSTFEEEFHRWIVDVYHQEGDSRYTRIPYDSWKHAIDVLPPNQMTNHDISRLSVIMGIKEEITLSSKGITYKYLRYDSTALSDYRKQFQQPPKGNYKLVKIDPDDLSYIYVFLKELGDGGEYLKVPCVDRTGYTKKLSLQKHEVICYFKRTYIKGKIDDVSLAKARMILHERIASEQKLLSDMGKKNKIAAKRKLAAYNDVSTTGNKSIKIDKVNVIVNTDEESGVDEILKKMNENIKESTGGS